MKYTTLGNTGLKVSQICLGCMGFGLDRQRNYTWTLGKEESIAIIDRAIELGINFFDTANVYSWGDSERVLGETLAGYDRDEFVITSKVFNEPYEHSHPNAHGLSRKTIDQELEHSLNRLGMEALDLYMIHRWDYQTPILETLQALDDAVRRGKVRYPGASSMWTYQFASALHTADMYGLERFVAMQNHYNLVYREEEREMLPLCKQEGIGVTPWSPIARGYLARPHEEFQQTERGVNETTRKPGRHENYRRGGGREINSRVEKLAEDHGVTMAQIAISWQLHNEWVDAPVLGITSMEHLETAVEAIEISLSSDDISYLEEPYEPVHVDGPK